MWRGSTIFWTGLAVQVGTGIVIGIGDITSVGVILIMLQPGFWLTVIGAGAWAVEIGTRQLVTSGSHTDGASEELGPMQLRPPPSPSSTAEPHRDLEGTEETVAAIYAELSAEPNLTRAQLLTRTGHAHEVVDRALEQLLSEREVSQSASGEFRLQG